MIEILEKPAAGPVIRLHDADNVVIARSIVEIGTRLGDGLTCRSRFCGGGGGTSLMSAPAGIFKRLSHACSGAHA